MKLCFVPLIFGIKPQIIRVLGMQRHQTIYKDVTLLDALLSKVSNPM
jgi:hypothetical protein